MNEEEKTLNLDDVKFLLEKVHAAQQAGNHVIFRHSNYSTEVIAMEGEISEEKEWDKQFYMHNNAPEEQKATSPRLLERKAALEWWIAKDLKKNEVSK